MRIIFFMLFCFLLSASSYSQQTTPDKCQLDSDNWEYMITLKDERWPSKLFCLPIAISNQVAISQLEKRLHSGVGIGVPLGSVIKGSISQDHGWSYHISPYDVEFGDVAIEVCDGTFQYVEENLERWMKEVGDFCPWGASERVIDIIHTNL